MITQNDIHVLVQAAALAGFDIERAQLRIERWDAGKQTHIPISLPVNCSAIYIFEWNDRCLKVGKVNQNSNQRYQYHHYNPDSSPSNLAKSLRSETEFHALVDEGHDTDWGNWIRENTTRYNIIVPGIIGPKFVHFTEAFFILKCNPVFENSIA